jgi:putative transposase
VSGERVHRKILYNDEFRFLSLASPRKGTAQVEPGRGVKVNYLYYWSEAFLSSTVERTQVPVRYDPFDIGTAFAYVQGRWVKCRSEYYLQLRGHMEARDVFAQMGGHHLLEDEQVSTSHHSSSTSLSPEQNASVVPVEREQDGDDDDVGDLDEYEELR